MMEKINLLKTMFEQSGLKQTELSKLSRVSLTTVNRYLRGNISEIKDEYYNPIYEILKKNNDEDSDDCSDVDVNNLKEKMMKNGIENNHIDHVETITTTIPSQIRTQNKTPRRGEIWYVRNFNATGNEILGSRPFLVMSDQKIAYSFNVVSGIFLTKQPKCESPFHISLKAKLSSFETSVALCEKVSSLSLEKFTTYMSTISDVEMALVEKAVMNSLGIKMAKSSDMYHSYDYIKLQTKLEMMELFYKDHIEILKQIG